MANGDPNPPKKKKPKERPGYTAAFSKPLAAEKMFQTLADQKINILAISTSEIKISVLIEEKYTNNAVKSLHSAYSLGINSINK